MPLQKLSQRSQNWIVAAFRQYFPKIFPQLFPVSSPKLSEISQVILNEIYFKFSQTLYEIIKILIIFYLKFFQNFLQNFWNFQNIPRMLVPKKLLPLFWIVKLSIPQTLILNLALTINLEIKEIFGNLEGTVEFDLLGHFLQRLMNLVLLLFD